MNDGSTPDNNTTNVSACQPCVMEVHDNIILDNAVKEEPPPTHPPEAEN